jgi:hypothetical protein
MPVHSDAIDITSGMTFWVELPPHCEVGRWGVFRIATVKSGGVTLGCVFGCAGFAWILTLCVVVGLSFSALGQFAVRL